MEALLTQGDSENFKSRFNSAFLAGSDYSLLPIQNHINNLRIRAQIKFSCKHCGRGFYQRVILFFENIRIAPLPVNKARTRKMIIIAVWHIKIIFERRIEQGGLNKHLVCTI